MSLHFKQEIMCHPLLRMTSILMYNVFWKLKGSIFEKDFLLLYYLVLFMWSVAFVLSLWFLITVNNPILHLAIIQC